MAGTVFSVSRVGKTLFWGQLAVTTTAKSVITQLSADQTPLTQFAQSLTLTNNDASKVIYLGWDNTVTSSKFFKQLAAGEYFELLLGQDAMLQIFAISTGNCNLSVSIGQ